MGTVINKVIIGGQEKLNLRQSEASVFEVVDENNFFLPTGHLTAGRLILDADAHYVVCTPSELADAEQVKEILATGIVGDTYKYTGDNATIEGHLYTKNAIYVVEDKSSSTISSQKDQLIRETLELLFQLDPSVNGKKPADIKASIGTLLDQYKEE